MAEAAAAAAVATTVAKVTRTAAAAMAKATVMATAAASWMPWLKFVYVGRWCKDGVGLNWFPPGDPQGVSAESV
jgi:hypothetical protein